MTLILDVVADEPSKFRLTVIPEARPVKDAKTSSPAPVSPLVAEGTLDELDSEETLSLIAEAARKSKAVFDVRQQIAELEKEEKDLAAKAKKQLDANKAKASSLPAAKKTPVQAVDIDAEEETTTSNSAAPELFPTT